MGDVVHLPQRSTAIELVGAARNCEAILQREIEDLFMRMEAKVKQLSTMISARLEVERKFGLPTGQAQPRPIPTMVEEPMEPPCA